MAYIADLPYKASSKESAEAFAGRMMRLGVVAGCAVFWGGIAMAVFG